MLHLLCTAGLDVCDSIQHQGNSSSEAEQMHILWRPSNAGDSPAQYPGYTHKFSSARCSAHSTGSVPVKLLFCKESTDKKDMRAQESGRLPTSRLLLRSSTWHRLQTNTAAKRRQMVWHCLQETRAACMCALLTSNQKQACRGGTVGIYLACYNLQQKILLL